MGLGVTVPLLRYRWGTHLIAHKACQLPVNPDNNNTGSASTGRQLAQAKSQFATCIYSGYAILLAIHKQQSTAQITCLIISCCACESLLEVCYLLQSMKRPLLCYPIFARVEVQVNAIFHTRLKFSSLNGLRQIPVCFHSDFCTDILHEAFNSLCFDPGCHSPQRDFLSGSHFFSFLFWMVGRGARLRQELGKWIPVYIRV